MLASAGLFMGWLKSAGFSRCWLVSVAGSGDGDHRQVLPGVGLRGGSSHGGSDTQMQLAALIVVGFFFVFYLSCVCAYYCVLLHA